MSSFNQTIVIGNLGRDPETRKAGETLIANFSVATSRRMKGEEVTDWHRVVAFGKLAEIVEKYLSKGDKVMIQGRMQYGSYERDGQTIPTAEIVANEMVMLGSPSSAGKPAPKKEKQDEIPF